MVLPLRAEVKAKILELISTMQADLQMMQERTKDLNKKLQQQIQQSTTVQESKLADRASTKTRELQIEEVEPDQASETDQNLASNTTTQNSRKTDLNSNLATKIQDPTLDLSSFTLKRSEHMEEGIHGGRAATIGESPSDLNSSLADMNNCVGAPSSSDDGDPFVGFDIELGGTNGGDGGAVEVEAIAPPPLAVLMSPSSSEQPSGGGADDGTCKDDATSVSTEAASKPPIAADKATATRSEGSEHVHMQWRVTTADLANEAAASAMLFVVLEVVTATSSGAVKVTLRGREAMPEGRPSQTTDGWPSVAAEGKARQQHGWIGEETWKAALRSEGRKSSKWKPPEGGRRKGAAAHTSGCGLWNGKERTCVTRGSDYPLQMGQVGQALMALGSDGSHYSPEGNVLWELMGQTQTQIAKEKMIGSNASVLLTSMGQAQFASAIEDKHEYWVMTDGLSFKHWDPGGFLFFFGSRIV